MGRDQTHSLEEGGVEVQGLEGQGAEVEGEGGVVGEVPEAEVGSSEDLAGKVSSLGGGKDQWWFQATCGTPCPQLLDRFEWTMVSLGFS